MLEGPELDRIGWCRLDQDGAPAIPDDEATVEPELELDASTGVRPPPAPSRQLEDRRTGPDRVVAGDHAAILEAADLIESEAGGQPPQGRLGVGRRHGEAAVEANDEPGQDPLGTGAIDGSGQPEFDDEVIPSSARARPSWVGVRVSASCSSSVWRLLLGVSNRVWRSR